MKRLSRPLAIAAVTLFAALPAHARECADVRFPDRVNVEGTSLTLNGLGIREATVFNVNVYVAALYVEQRSGNGAQILASDTKKRLVLRFLRDVDRADIVGAFQEGFQHSGGGGAMAPRVRQLNGWVPAAREGASWTFTYVPGAGLHAAFGGRERGVVPGADFARAFFGIWIGSHPPNPGLKRGLLGGPCG